MFYNISNSLVTYLNCCLDIDEEIPESLISFPWPGLMSIMSSYQKHDSGNVNSHIYVLYIYININKPIIIKLFKIIL